jgi:hypothetical protein
MSFKIEAGMVSTSQTHTLGSIVPFRHLDEAELPLIRGLTSPLSAIGV